MPCCNGAPVHAMHVSNVTVNMHNIVLEAQRQFQHVFMVKAQAQPFHTYGTNQFCTIGV